MCTQRTCSLCVIYTVERLTSLPICMQYSVNVQVLGFRPKPSKRIYLYIRPKS